MQSELLGWKTPENRFACEFFQALLAFELNKCHGIKKTSEFQYFGTGGPELLPSTISDIAIKVSNAMQRNMRYFITGELGMIARE